MNNSFILINSILPEVRVAVIEDGHLSELYIERENDQSLVGNIYLGRVVKVLPGMQASFIDIGLEKAAFLYVADAYSPFQESSKELENPPSPPIKVKIEEILQEGQEIFVQVAKDPIKGKGARVTTHITIPGRYLVYMPYFNHLGISRRIENNSERQRLRSILQEIRPATGGLIARTAAEGVSRQQLENDVEFLSLIWKEIQTRRKKATPPALIFKELSVILRSIRDLCDENISKVIIDNPDDYHRIKRFLKAYMPSSNLEVELYHSTEPLFDAFNLTSEIQKALSRKVYLKSGAYLTIDQTDALTAIDVNTGSFVGQKSLQETVVQTNLEAVNEIVRQLRIRNIGGLIVIDFIDMERPEDREKVYSALSKALKRDRAKSNVLKISALGLVEMTRKRVRESLGRTLTEPCFYCQGRGTLKSKTTVSYEIFRELLRIADNFNSNTIQIFAHPDVVETLYNNEKEVVQHLEELLNKRIVIRAKETLHLEKFTITSY